MREHFNEITGILASLTSVCSSVLAVIGAIGVIAGAVASVIGLLIAWNSWKVSEIKRRKYEAIERQESLAGQSSQWGDSRDGIKR